MANIGNYVIEVQTAATPHTWVGIPNKMISYESYKVTPNQMIDLDSYVAETGYLIRNVLSHSRTKIEFNTPYCTDADWRAVWAIISNGFTDATARKCKIRYYNPFKDTTETATCYVPDVDLTMRNVDFSNSIINYDPIRVAFIEY